MKTIARRYGLDFSLLLSCLLSCLPALLAQTNPPPFDPREMVTRQPQTLTKQADRSAALDLLDRARQNFNLYDVKTPYSLKASFETSGAAQYEGDWTMEEFSDGGSHWRWSAQLRDLRVTRIGVNDRVYGTNASEPIPLRVQLVRSALHSPFARHARGMAMRAASVDRDGKETDCLLLSGAIPPNPAPRSWYESEYCIDPSTALLRMWSEAPGIYAVYDYTGATPFHGHTLPRQITIFEDGNLALQARIESLEDNANIDATLFKRAPEMEDAEESFTLASPNRLPMRVDPSDAPTSTYFQPVIIHAILDAQDGTVLDAESLQNSDRDLSRQAMDLVKSTSFPASGFQQEVFINVQFHFPAAQYGGPPLFHSPVRWIVLDHRGRPPVRRTPGPGTRTIAEPSARTPATLPN